MVGHLSPTIHVSAARPSAQLGMVIREARNKLSNTPSEPTSTTSPSLARHRMLKPPGATQNLTQRIDSTFYTDKSTNRARPAAVNRLHVVMFSASVVGRDTVHSASTLDDFHCDAVLRAISKGSSRPKWSKRAKWHQSLDRCAHLHGPA